MVFAKHDFARREAGNLIGPSEGTPDVVLGSAAADDAFGEVVRNAGVERPSSGAADRVLEQAVALRVENIPDLLGKFRIPHLWQTSRREKACLGSPCGPWPAVTAGQRTRGTGGLAATIERMPECCDEGTEACDTRCRTQSSRRTRGPRKNRTPQPV